MLTVGHADNQAVQRVGDFNLAGQARVGLGGGGKVQHVFFHFGLCPQLGLPWCRDVNMAGGAGAAAATVGVNAGHVVVDGGAHQGQTAFGGHSVLGAVEFYEGDLGHGVSKLGLKRFRGGKKLYKMLIGLRNFGNRLGDRA